MTTSLLICRDPRGSEWQLGPLPPARGHLTLIGWRQHPEPVDDGVPNEVAAVIARALTSIGVVMFLASDAKTPGLVEWIRARFSGVPAGAMLLATHQPDQVVRLFDDPGFPWWLQGQIALLATTGTTLPDIKTVLSLTNDHWTRQTGTLASQGVQGALRPGVDGDIAGLLSLSATFEQAALAALERETRAAGFDWALLDEQAFAQRLMTS